MNARSDLTNWWFHQETKSGESHKVTTEAPVIFELSHFNTFCEKQHCSEDRTVWLQVDCKVRDAVHEDRRHRLKKNAERTNLRKHVSESENWWSMNWRRCTHGRFCTQHETFSVHSGRHRRTETLQAEHYHPQKVQRDDWKYERELHDAQKRSRQHPWTFARGTDFTVWPAAVQTSTGQSYWRPGEFGDTCGENGHRQRSWCACKATLTSVLAFRTTRWQSTTRWVTSKSTGSSSSRWANTRWILGTRHRTPKSTRVCRNCTFANTVWSTWRLLPYSEDMRWEVLPANNTWWVFVCGKTADNLVWFNYRPSVSGDILLVMRFTGRTIYPSLKLMGRRTR